MRATAVVNDGSLTTAAVPAVAPSASGSRERNESRLGAKNYSMPSISMSSSLSRRDRRNCLSECQHGLQDPVPHCRRDVAHHRFRSPTSRRSDRVFRGAAHLGAESQPSSPSLLSRARRRAVAGRQPLDFVPSRLFPTGRRALPTLRAIVSREVCKRHLTLASCDSFRHWNGCTIPSHSGAIWIPPARSTGWSMPTTLRGR